MIPVSIFLTYYFAVAKKNAQIFNACLFNLLKLDQTIESDNFVELK